MEMGSPNKMARIDGHRPNANGSSSATPTPAPPKPFNPNDDEHYQVGLEATLVSLPGFSRNMLNQFAMLELHMYLSTTILQ